MAGKKIASLIIAVFLSFLTIIFLFNYQQPEEIACDKCNVILITIENLRADHVGIYGYYRNTTPNIDNLFRQGFIFKNSFSQAPNTLPSMMSVFTGLYPSHHGMISFDVNHSLPEEDLTLAKILKLYDYKTEAIYDGNDLIGPKYGFSRGFDTYTINDFVQNTTQVFSFINSSKNNRFFLFLFNGYLHDPYLAEPPYETKFDNNYTGKIIGDFSEFASLVTRNKIVDNFYSVNNDTDFNKIRTFYWSFVNKSDPRDIYHLQALYDSNLNDVDAGLGRLFNYLDSEGLLNNTVIILTSGHGEEFGEHGFLHQQLYDMDLHVPLLIFIPGAKSKVISNQVGGIDVMPTVLSILGIQQPADIDGRSLKFLMQNPNAQDTNQLLHLEFVNQQAIRTPQWKLIHRTNSSTYEFYDLIADPGENQNLDGGNLTQEKYFIQILDQWEKTANTSTNLRAINSTFIGYP